MLDMSQTIAPKSDQLNADDLIGGDRTIIITKVTGCEDPQQPVSVYYEGSNKPYKPCKSMRRVMVQAWGKLAAQYAGRSMTLFRDPEVMFGGMKVGGIRISHMSHITSPVSMPLTASKTKRAMYTVKVLQVLAAQKPNRTITEAVQYFGDALSVTELGARWKEVSQDWALYNADEQSQLTAAKDARKAALTAPPVETAPAFDDEPIIELED